MSLNLFWRKGRTPFSKWEGEGQQQVKIPVFYGVKLDRNDPYLEHNLDRLEKRFKERCLDSMEKNQKRKEEGKKPHQTTLKSIENNNNRLAMVRIVREYFAINMS